jgi:very-short-patch-repair endonuclease
MGRAVPHRTNGTCVPFPIARRRRASFRTPLWWGKDGDGGSRDAGEISVACAEPETKCDQRRAAPGQGLRRKEVGGFRFRRQVALGGFIADFASFDARLLIEVDGATHSTDEELARDAARAAALAAQGFALLRFTNDEVFHNLDGVLDTIRPKLVELRPRIEDSLA